MVTHRSGEGEETMKKEESRRGSGLMRKTKSAEEWKGVEGGKDVRL